MTENTEGEDKGKRKTLEKKKKSTKISFETLTGMGHEDERFPQTCIEMCVWLKCVNSVLLMHMNRVSVSCNIVTVN